MRTFALMAMVFVVLGCDQQPPAKQANAKPPVLKPEVGAKDETMNWDDPRDPIAITVAEVVAGQTSILLVIHDTGHGGWQFLDGEDVKGRKPKVIPKVELLKLDPSLIELKDLPVGWRARRASLKDPWMREKNPSAR